MMYPVKEGTSGLVPALDKICEGAADAARDGFTIIMLSDKKAGKEFVPIRYAVRWRGRREVIGYGRSKFSIEAQVLNVLCFDFSSLLCLGAVHHYLIRHKLRMKVGLLVETGEAR